MMKTQKTLLIGSNASSASRRKVRRALLIEVTAAITIVVTVTVLYNVIMSRISSLDLPPLPVNFAAHSSDALRKESQNKLETSNTIVSHKK
jgi:hypothetical protein